MRKALSLLILWSGLVLACSGAPERPTAQVKGTTDKIIAILNNPNLQGPDHRAERHRLIREELEQRFDWPTICRGCLGHHWTKLSQPQRTEFIDLFKRFLERTYLDRIEPYYNDLDKIDYVGEKVIDQYASVKTVISTKQKIDHPVEYRLEGSPAEGWKVYDIVIEGVSLVSNYRTQFNDIITKSSFEALMNDLRSKADAAKT